MKKTNLLFPLLLAAALGGGVASCGGDKKAETPETTGESTPAPAPATPAVGNAMNGKGIYQQTCSSCHGTEGKGDGPAAATLNPKPADHTSKEIIGKRSDEELTKIIKMGGAVVGKPTMPPSPQLSDDEVRDVVAHLRELSGTEHH